MAPEREQLLAGIAALEAQRGRLGDAVVDASVCGLRARLATLDAPAFGQSLRQVTILFMDIVGSTALSQQLDPEDVHALVDGALARCTAIVEAHLGKVVQYAGDNLLAVFGADESREDDAERAVRAGLALVAEGRLVGEEVQRQYFLPGFDVRVGVHTGRVLLGGGVDAEGSIRGIAVNIAARMEQSAPAGALRISQDTHRHVRGVFDVEPQLPLKVKGVDGPIVTYLVRRAKPRAFRVPTRGVEGVETPIVGRDLELRQLQQDFLGLYLKPGAPGGVAATLVVAEAGIGKSRLLHEFQHWAEARAERFLVFLGRALPQTQAQPYGLLRDLVAWRLEISDSDPASVARDKLNRALAPLFDADGEANAHLLGHLIGMDFSASAHVRGILQDAQQVRDRGFHAGVQMLRCMARTTALPVVMMLDDLHWADDGSLDFIDHLLQASAELPLLLIGLARPSLFERRPKWLHAACFQRRIGLQALGPSDSQALAGALLQRIDDPPAVLRELIVGGAQGNPFYMEELLKMLIDEGAILTDRQPWQVVADRLLAAHVPTTLTGVLQARLDTLAESDRRVLQRASVVGVVFWDRALTALQPDSSPQDVPAASDSATAAAIESLLRRELIYTRRPSTLAGAREFGFKHQILQQVTYDSMLKRHRREYHARAAAWLAAQTGDRATEHLGSAAEHWERAGDAAEACDLYARAAEWAVSRGANTQMLVYVGRALELAAADDHAARWRLLAVRERFLVTGDDRAAHAADLAAMQVLAEALDDDARRADLLWRRAFALEDTGDFAAAAEQARRSLELALSCGAVTVAAKAYAGLGYDLMRMDRLEQAQRAVEDGLALVRANGLRALEPHLLTDAGGIARAQGDLAGAAAHFEAALAITRELGNRGNEAMMLNNLGDSALRLGDYAAAREHLLGSVAVARSTGNRTAETLALQNLAAVAHLQGDDAAALAWAQSALDLQVAMDLRQQQATSLLVLGHAELGTGGLEAAHAAYERARALFDAAGMQAMVMEALAGLARVAMARGNLAQAWADVQLLLEYRERGGSFDGAEEPLRVVWTCWQVSSAAGDSRAPGLLADAHAELQARAARIGDERWRDCLLNAVPHHREIERAWASQHRRAGRS